MNKTHWNSIKTNGKVANRLLKEWIKDSRELVVAGLPKKIQKASHEE